jgi:hypothetical protein
VLLLLSASMVTSDVDCCVEEAVGVLVVISSTLSEAS